MILRKYIHYNVCHHNYFNVSTLFGNDIIDET